MNLYDFITENSIDRMTTAKANVTLAGNEYQATTLQRTEYNLDPIITKNKITITFAGDNTFARQFLLETTLSLRVIIYLIDGTPFYRGKLVRSEYTTDNKINLLFDPDIILGTVLMGERRLYQRNCPFELYGKNCRARIRRHSVRVTVITSPKKIKVQYDTGNSENDQRGDFRFNVLLNPDIDESNVNPANIGFLIGGLAFDGERRLWITNIEDRVASGAIVEFELVFFREHSFSVGDNIEIAIGCQRTTASCRDLHNNIVNYGGFAGLTKASPFAGGLQS